MFYRAIATKYRSQAKLLGLCDINQTRMDYVNSRLTGEYGETSALPTFKPWEFDTMIRKLKPHGVIVTSVDRTHHHYITRAMELGCDAITEKPMTIDENKCQHILDTVRNTGKKLTVTFNYRYAPARSKVKEVIRSGAIGKVTSVHFEWLLDTQHGADYFRRWHRDKRNSGGLMVHKSTHHFDLVNWWLDTHPELVYGLGKLAFYGRANAEARGVQEFYHRGTGSKIASKDPFSLDLKKNKDLKAMYLDAEHEDGYLRDQSVFGDGINIEDTMNVLVRYKSGAQLSYSLTAYSPWEGYRVMFNGTKGRLELQDVEKSYVSGKDEVMGQSIKKGNQIWVFPHFQKPYEVIPPKPVGGHGGGDDPLLDDLFSRKRKNDPLGHAAGHEDGAWSILTGIAANKSFATGQPVRADQLIRI